MECGFDSRPGHHLNLLMKTVGFVYSILAAVMWGLVYAVSQKLVEKSSPLAVIFIEAILVMLFLLPLFLYDSGFTKTVIPDFKANWLLFCVSVILMIIANFLILSGIKILGASTASIFEIAYPFFVVIFSYFLYRTEIGLAFVAGAALIFIGSYIIIKFSP